MLLFSGVNPDKIRGTKTGVFVGAGPSDSYYQWTTNMENNSGYEMVGNMICMVPNRLSYWFDFQGDAMCVRFLCEQCTAKYCFTFFTVQRLCTARYLKPVLGSNTKCKSLMKRSSCLSSVVCLSSVCLSRVRSRKLSEMDAKFRHFYRKSGSPSKNMTSHFAPEVAKWPKSILPQQQFQECASLLLCFAPLAMQLVCMHNACVTATLWYCKQATPFKEDYTAVIPVHRIEIW